MQIERSEDVAACSEERLDGYIVAMTRRRGRRLRARRGATARRFTETLDGDRQHRTHEHQQRHGGDEHA